MITVNRKSFQLGLSRLKRAIGVTSELSILSKVWINRTAMMGTDLRNWVKVPILDDQGEEMDIGFDRCISYKELLALVGKLKGDTFDIELKENNVEIVGGGVKAIIATFNSAEFPELPDVPDKSKMKELPADFRVGAMHCMDHTSEDQARYFMTGVNIDGKMMVATDGRRMALYEMDIEMDTALISKPTLEIFLGMDLNLYLIDEQNIWFSGLDGVIRGGLIEGKFPNYERVRPQGTPDVECELTAEAISGSDVIKLFKNGTDSMRVFILLNDGILQMKSNNDHGEVIFSHELESYDGEEVTFYMNYQYLMDAMKDDVMDLKLYDVRDVDGSPKIVLSAGKYSSTIMGMVRE